MRSFKVIPDVVSAAPKYLLNVTYENRVKVHLGNELTIAQTKNAPVKVAWPFEVGELYSLFMVDPDAPSRQNPRFGQWMHWLVVNISNNTISTGNVIMSYNGPNPPQGTGFHRYVFLVYKQEKRSKGRQNFASIANRAKFNVTQYAKSHNLNELVSGNFFQTKRG
ncbi:OV-16 antigen precursor-like protein [Leptotrombidium deliense]|uniref:OV-16 antigen-like protein n=1 Tax=Leptotrombidium deliense TaxID=299467 RepID=A0A443SF35_9ACAR|nr:OV-16 antigen precursor-like protein [Leptotrombidium deliense]